VLERFLLDTSVCVSKNYDTYVQYIYDSDHKSGIHYTCALHNYLAVGLHIFKCFYSFFNDKALTSKNVKR
jgi:hypothetical protein